MDAQHEGIVGYAVVELVQTPVDQFVAVARMFQHLQRARACENAERQRKLRPGHRYAVAEVRLIENFKELGG